MAFFGPPTTSSCPRSHLTFPSREGSLLILVNCSPDPTTNSKFCFYNFFAINCLLMLLLSKQSRNSQKNCKTKFGNSLSDPVNSILYYTRNTKLRRKRLAFIIYNSSYKNDLVKPAAAKEMITMKVYRT